MATGNEDDDELNERITARVKNYRAACTEHGKHVTLDGAVYDDVAAELLDVAAGTLSNWRYNGTGPRWYRCGVGHRGRVRYDLRDLATFVESRLQYNST